MPNMILQVLKTQSTLLFSGKINILLKRNAQFYGVIFFQEGRIINAKLKSRLGKKVLFQLILIAFRKDFEENYELVLEPDLLGHKDEAFNLSHDEMLSDFTKYLTTLAPHGDLTLSLKVKDLYAGLEEFFPQKELFLTILLLTLRSEGKLKIQ